MGSQKRFVFASVFGIVAVLAGLGFLGYRLVQRIGLAVQGRWETGRTREYRLASDDLELVSVSVSDIDLAGVESLRIVGGWDLHLAAADSPSLAVSSTAAHQNNVVVRRRDSTLVLEVADETNYSRARFKAEIAVPELSSLEIVGMANVRLRGFEQDSLAIDAEGAASVTAEESSFESLDLAFEGTGKIDFSSSPVTNARVNVAGLANVDILMNGGVLEGIAEGLGRVSYRGTVAEMRLDTDGGFVQAIGQNEQ